MSAPRKLPGKWRVRWIVAYGERQGATFASEAADAAK